MNTIESLLSDNTRLHFSLNRRPPGWFRMTSGQVGNSSWFLE